MLPLSVLSLILASCLLPAGVQGEPLTPIRLERVASGFESPVYVTGAGDGRLFVVEQAGVIRVLQKGESGAGSVFLDIRDRVDSGGEKGLLSVAFHPDFKANRRFFVNYTTQDKGLWTRVSEFKASPDGRRGDPASEKVLLTFRQPYENHNGGLVLFGPDRYLYIGTGDGGSANDPHDNGQRLDTLLGKILRVDVNRAEAGKPYGIPADNPFVGKAGALPEIYAYGLRNPWRFSFDRKTGWLWAADVGQNDREEIDVVRKGLNYGWRVMEGTICTPKFGKTCGRANLVPPVLDYGREEGVSVTGGYVYRGAKIPALIEIYLFSDFGSGTIWGLDAGGQKSPVKRVLLRSGLPVSSFGEDDEGEIYVVDYGGTIYRIAP